MKQTIIAILAAAAVPCAAMAQSAIDALEISQPDFKGTARFMSMGGAFTALGGDLSTLNQNPAGIGIYRSSEIGATLDINFQSTKTEPGYPMVTPSTNSQTKAYCNNFGYIGSVPLDGSMRTFNWGVTYNRAASFDRVYRGGIAQSPSSMSDYVAAFTNGTATSAMDFTSGYNPYLDGNADWMSILAYNSYIINPTAATNYEGLSQPGTTGDAIFSVREKGYVDEYDISFGGNVENVVYWGMTVGITDLNYQRFLYYSESMGNALINDFSSNGLTTGSANFDLTTPKYINGTGWNLKLGLIFKPVNELRIGFAIHTPTWYHLQQGYNGEINSDFTPTIGGMQAGDTHTANDYTEDAYFNWHYNAPWKLMAGVAGVIGGRAIISLDYQYDGYGDMRVATPVYYNGWDNGFEPNETLNQDIQDYFKASNTVRLGLEFRVSPQFSLRAGYNYTTTNVRSEASEGALQVYTSGTDPSYAFDKSIQHITCGMGYRYKAWYIDAAFVYKTRDSRFHAYTNFGGNFAPQWKLTDTNTSLVFSTGFKF